MFKTLQDVYAAIPAIQCKGQCQGSCGIIPLFPVEAQAIAASGGKMPQPGPTMTCQALVPMMGNCSIYANRPLICRLWGVVPEMPCPYGCQPDRWLTKPEQKALLTALKQLSGGEGASVYCG